MQHVFVHFDSESESLTIDETLFLGYFVCLILDTLTPFSLLSFLLVIQTNFKVFPIVSSEIRFYGFDFLPSLAHSSANFW